MDTIAFYDTKPYDKKWFSLAAKRGNMDIRWLETRLGPDTAVLSHGCRAVCAFVNDVIDERVLETFAAMGVEALALRSAGYNNVDLKAAEKFSIPVFRVPSYSPESVAEHAAAMLLTLARKTHRAFTRTRERNFSLDGLCGFNLCGKTVGIIGTGKIGMAFANICKGFGMRIIADDAHPTWGRGIEYVRFDELCRRSDIISLHCPLTPQTYHLISRSALHMMKPGVYIINTSRGALVDSEALLEAVKSGTVGAAGLDVYEEEADVFYEDVSSKVMRDDTLNLLLSQPNVLVTSHQAFLTDEALQAIAETTIENLSVFFGGNMPENTVTAEKVTASK